MKDFRFGLVLAAFLGLSPMLAPLPGLGQMLEEQIEEAELSPLCTFLPKFSATRQFGLVELMAVSGNGKFLATVNELGIIKTWDLDNGKLINQIYDRHHALKKIALSPDGKITVSVSVKERLYGNKDTNQVLVTAWVTQTGKKLFSEQQEGHSRIFDQPGSEKLILTSSTESSYGYQYDYSIEFLQREAKSKINNQAVQELFFIGEENEWQHLYPSIKTETSAPKSFASTILERFSKISLYSDGTQKSCVLLSRLDKVFFNKEEKELIVLSNGRLSIFDVEQQVESSSILDHTLRIQKSNELGLYHLNRKRYKAAEYHFQKVLRLSQEMGDIKGQIDALYKIAEISYESRKYCVRSKCRYIPDYKFLAPYLRSMGDAERHKIAMERSSEIERLQAENHGSLQKKLESYRSMEQHELVADTLVEISILNGFNIEASQPLLNEALNLYRNVGNKEKQLQVLHALGVSFSITTFKDKKSSHIPREMLSIEASSSLEYLNQALYLSQELKDSFVEGIVLLDMGDIHQLIGRPQDALLAYKKALEVHETLEDDSYRATLLYKVAQSHRKLRNYSHSNLNLQEVVEVCNLDENCFLLRREYPDLMSIEAVNTMLGRNYFDLGLYTKALQYIRRGWALGLIYKKLGDYDQALKYFHSAIPNGGRGSTGPMCGGASSSDATIIDSVRRHVSGHNFGCGSHKDLDEWKIRIETAIVHTAEIYRRRGLNREAIETYERAISLYGSHSRARRDNYYSRVVNAMLLNNLGTLYKSQGQYNKARKVYEESLWIRREIKDAYGEAISLNNIGEIQRLTGKYSTALETYQKALKIFRKLETHLTSFDNKAIPILSVTEVRNGKSSVLHNLGSLSTDLGTYNDAINLFTQSLNISTSLNDQLAVGRTLNNIGLLYTDQQKYSVALEYYQKALAARQEAGDRPGIAATLNNIGLLQIKLNQPNQGIEPLQQSLSIYQKLEDKASIANTLDSLGTLYTALGQTDKAFSSYNQALQGAKDINLPPLQAVILSNTGKLLSQTEQPELAIAFYKQSVNTYQSIRQNTIGLDPDLQQSYTESIADTYRTLADLLIDQGRLAEAQQVLELLKLQELRDFTRSTDDTPQGEIALLALEQEILAKHNNSIIQFSKKLNQCEQTNGDCAALRDDLDALTDAFYEEATAFQTELRQRLAQDPAFLTADQLSGVATQVVTAQSGTALIYPLVLEDKIRLLLAIPAGEKGAVFRTVDVEGVGQQQLWQVVSRFRDRLSTNTSDLSKLQTDAAQLYDWLIRPLEAELSQDKDIQHLVFALDRATRYAPMAALYDSQTNQYLAQKYATSTILAAELTDTNDRLPAASDQVSVLGLGLSDPVSGFAALNNVPTELDTIVQQDKPTDTKGIYNGLELLNGAFDFRSFRDNIGDRQIVHIATHGAFKPGQPENSFILSGKGDPLRIKDIKKLRNYMKDVHLVVLSACQTAVGGPDETGIEIPGISFYFLQNNVKSVMASLWLVNDASTSELMQRFYANLAAGQSKAEALRKAQLSLMAVEQREGQEVDRASIAVVSSDGTTGTAANSSFSHPYYWAPFILIGNGL